MFWVDDQNPISLQHRAYLPNQHPHKFFRHPHWRAQEAHAEAAIRRQRLRERQQAYDSHQQQVVARRRAQQAEWRREQILARKKRALQVREHEARVLKARRLRYLSVSVAARTIQRWWRAARARRDRAAAEVVAAALQRNAAVKRSRRVARAIAALRGLERRILDVTNPFDELNAASTPKQRTKARLVFEHTLERLTLDADGVSTHGNETARALRKRLVVTANARLQEFDDLVAAESAAESSEASDADIEAEPRGCTSGTDATGSATAAMHLGVDAAASPTTPEPTTSEPTTSEPTTSESTTSEPTTTEPTTSEPTTSEPTTQEPTTSEPTTSLEQLERASLEADRDTPMPLDVIADDDEAEEAPPVEHAAVEEANTDDSWGEIEVQSGGDGSAANTACTRVIDAKADEKIGTTVQRRDDYTTGKCLGKALEDLDQLQGDWAAAQNLTGMQREAVQAAVQQLRAALGGL